MVSLFRARPTILVSLLRKFADSDDEYIAERVVVASYGAILLHPSPPHLHEAATELYKYYFAEGAPPLNASLRDHARLIIEMAVELVKIPAIR
jgi:alpha-ketoglutarate-dependent taurine dioxygenase